MNSLIFILKFFWATVWVLIMQIAIFDNLLISNFVYIPAYLVLFVTMPRIIKTIPMMIISFALGTLIDYLSGSEGLITSVLVTLSVIRPHLVKFIVPMELVSGTQTIKYKYVWFRRYIIYVTVMVVMFNVLLFAIEGILFLPFETVLYKTVLSTVATIPVMLTLQLFIFDKYE